MSKLTRVLAVRPCPDRLCNVDLLRGIAAIAILFWHYQHFYYPEAAINPIAGKPAEQPLYSVFSWFYVHGAWAVSFFWILSGFVFFQVYGRRQQVTAWEFFRSRFSRLYPMHFITLCLVALLQTVSWQLFGHFQIYPMNDAWHYVLNLFMASHWGFEKGWSFNAPIWSISVEVLVYCMFFVFLKAVGIRPFTSILWFLWSLLFYRGSQNPVFDCASLFALGGLVNQVYAWLRDRPGVNLNIITAGTVFAISIASIKAGWFAVAVGVKWGLFPSLIWMAAALDAKNVSSGVLGLGLGNITYSSYLLHVPVQILTLMVLDGMVGNRALISHAGFLITYILGVVCMAALAYRFVEMPLKVGCTTLLTKYQPQGK